jgi:uncharacterized protein
MVSNRLWSPHNCDSDRDNSTQDSPPELHLAASITFLRFFLVRFFIGGGLGEELGWRGFMLPALQKRWCSIQSSILVGIAWGVWY